MIHVTVWGGLATFSLFGYTPLRYLVIYFPLLRPEGHSGERAGVSPPVTPDPS